MELPGYGREMRGKERGSALGEGEGGACFEVSPRWPEEVKSRVNLQVNARGDGEQCPQLQRTPCCNAAMCVWVKQRGKPECGSERRQCSCSSRSTFACMSKMPIMHTTGRFRARCGTYFHVSSHYEEIYSLYGNIKERQSVKRNNQSDVDCWTSVSVMRHKQFTSLLEQEQLGYISQFDS